MQKKENRYSVAKDLAANPTNLMKNGVCSKCGGCCSNILPLSEQDIRRLRSFAEEHKFVPRLPAGANLIYAHCPFLIEPDPETQPGVKICAAYDARPDVCRIFLCSNTNDQNARAWMTQFGAAAMPEPANVWQVFNRTGLRYDGIEIPYDQAPLCRVANDKREAYEFHVGRPVSVMLENDEFVPPSMILNISQLGLQIFNGAKNNVQFISFGQIDQILSEACRVEFTEDMEKCAVDGGNSCEPDHENTGPPQTDSNETDAGIPGT